MLLPTLDVLKRLIRRANLLQPFADVFRMPKYHLRMIRSYLRDRELRFDTVDGQRGREITDGIAPGSILSLDLWNAFYDGIVRMQKPFLSAYTEDVAAVIAATNTEDAHCKFNQVIWVESAAGWKNMTVLGAIRLDQESRAR